MFDGKKSSYHSWREKFLQCIHAKQTSPAVKALALQVSLDAEDPKLELLSTSISLTDGGYKEAIEDLEADYGGDHRLRQECLLQVLEGEEVKAGDLESVHSFELRVKSYVSAIDKAGRPNAMDEETEHFSAIAAKVDALLGVRFCDWLAQARKVPCIRNLQTFLKREVNQCRRLADFYNVMLERRQEEDGTVLAQDSEEDEY